jgi:hypothetical protein
MGEPIMHNAFKVIADSNHLTLKLYLRKDGADLGPIEINTKEASQIAAVVLGNAELAYDHSGRPAPFPGKEYKVDLTVVTPSGLGIGPGRKSGSTILLAHFGDATLGLEFPNKELRKFAQQLLTVAADEGSKQ